MTADELVRVFGYLRETCDPRGHHVLDALEDVLSDMVEAGERLEDVHDKLFPVPLPHMTGDVATDWATVQAMVGVGDLFDTDDHSKSAELRMVRGGRCV